MVPPVMAFYDWEIAVMSDYSLEDEADTDSPDKAKNEVGSDRPG